MMNSTRNSSETAIHLRIQIYQSQSCCLHRRNSAPASPVEERRLHFRLHSQALRGGRRHHGHHRRNAHFFTQLFQFPASYDDLPAFTFFVVANAIASSYLVLSLPFSIIGIVRPHAAGIKLLLLIFDMAAAAAIVYLAHNGNFTVNWLAICQQFTSFCLRVSGAVAASFIAAVILIFLVVLSAVALRSH